MSIEIDQEHTPCSRPTKQGNPCRFNAVRWESYEGSDPVSCQRHLTVDEKARSSRGHPIVPEFRKGGLIGEPLTDEEQERIRVVHMNRDPACWSWPAPETCTFKDADTAERFLRWWNAVCAICEESGDLVIDHDHATGLVRGRLCRTCNIKEGMSDAPIFRKYRKRNPASILGIEEQYWSPFTGYAEPEQPMTAEEWQQVRAAVDRMSIPLPGPEDLQRTETTDGR